MPPECELTLIARFNFRSSFPNCSIPIKMHMLEEHTVQGCRRPSGCTVLTGPLFLPAVSVSDPFYSTIVCSCTASHVHRYDLLLASVLTSHATKCGDQYLICYWTHQHVVSYKVTKLAVPLKMATIADGRESISSLPDEPNHPKCFTFLKRSFRKTKPVFRSAKNKWFDT